MFCARLRRKLKRHRPGESDQFKFWLCLKTVAKNFGDVDNSAAAVVSSPKVGG